MNYSVRNKWGITHHRYPYRINRLAQHCLFLHQLSPPPPPPPPVLHGRMWLVDRRTPRQDVTKITTPVSTLLRVSIVVRILFLQNCSVCSLVQGTRWMCGFRADWLGEASQVNHNPGVELLILANQLTSVVRTTSTEDPRLRTYTRHANCSNCPNVCGGLFHS